MGFEDTYLNIVSKLPGITIPIKRLTFNSRIKWTAIILLIYFIFTQIRVWGVNEAQIQSFGLFETLLGAKFGSVMSLGIGPIVTASIILQLMVKPSRWRNSPPGAALQL